MTTTTKTLHVSVTAEDIENGIGRECGNCPIALAVLRALPNCHWSTRVWFTYQGFGVAGRLEITQGTKATVTIPNWDFPDGLEEFAMDFDDWSDRRLYDSDEEYLEEMDKEDVPFPPEPFEFELELPEECHDHSS